MRPTRTTQGLENIINCNSFDALTTTYLRVGSSDMMMMLLQVDVWSSRTLQRD